MSLLLSPFQTLIKARTGLMLEDANSIDKLASSIQVGMELECIHSPERYLAQLTENQQSFQALINRLTINETYFFREPEQIDLLVDVFIPQWQQQFGGRPIRILSAGCSSGEEPYSIVMALIERFGEAALSGFNVVGADIDSQVLAKAMKARYNEFSFRGVSVDRRHRFFDRIGDAFQLKENIRLQVSFKELNLFAPMQSPELREFDVIFFRNVSIYFDTPTRKTIQQNLNQMLTDQGVLMIGTAETLANDLGVLRLVERNGLFYFSKLSAKADGVVVPNLSKQANRLSANFVTEEQPKVPPEPLRPLAILADKQKLIHLLAEKQYDQAFPLAEALLIATPQDHQTRLLKAFILMNRKQWEAAEALLMQALQQDDWCLDALVLLGLLAKWQGRIEQAIEWFKKAVYAHSDRWLVHYYLADSYYRQQQSPLALRGFKTALQLMDKHPELSDLRWVPLDFSMAEMRFLCQHHIQKLTAQGKDASHGN